MFKYPVKIETDTVGVLLSCRDLPDYYDSGDTVNLNLKLNSLFGCFLECLTTNPIKK